MRVILLGAKGNLGSQLDLVLRSDMEVFAFDKEDFNVLNFRSLSEVISDISPDVVINTVAYNQVDNCENKEDYEKALLLNRDLPAFLAELALKLDYILVHYSSDYVFSGLETKPDFLEEDTPNPVNKYGESKFLGESEIEKLKSKGLKYYLIRTSKLFGPRVENSLAKPSYFDTMLKLSETKSEMMTVNEELSCFTYTPDLASASSRLILAQPSYGVYHLINENPATWHQGAMELFQQAKRDIHLRPVRSEDLARAARRPKYSVLVNTKLKKLRPYQDALREYLKTIL